MSSLKVREMLNSARVTLEEISMYFKMKDPRTLPEISKISESALKEIVGRN